MSTSTTSSPIKAGGDNESDIVAMWATETPQPGLIVQGEVHLHNAAGPGQAGVQVYRGSASHLGGLVATTDQNGYYTTDFHYIPGDETMLVWAKKPGFTLDPPQYWWRHCYGYELKIADFIARPLTTTCSQELFLTPYRLLVSRNSWHTEKLSYRLYIYLGGGNGTNSAASTITITSQAGVVVVTGTLSTDTSMPITVSLLPGTAHHFTVYGQFVDYSTGCFYTTSTMYDSYGYPLIIVQESPSVYLPLVRMDMGEVREPGPGRRGR